MIAALLLAAAPAPPVPTAQSTAERPFEASEGDAAVVLAMLEQSCFECHGPTKQKGRLRLDRPEGLASVLTAGDAEASEILRRVSLDPDDLDVMPPDGPAVPAGQRAALRRWILAGAPMGGVAEGQAQAAALAAVTARRLDAVREAAGARIDAAGGGGERLAVDWSLGSAPLTARQLAALTPLADLVHELSLAGRAWDRGALAALPELPALHRLHLERSELGDAELRALLAVSPELTYLNLHSTAVSAAVLPALLEARSLRRLVLYGTGIGEGALEELRAARPDLHVTGGIALPADPFTTSRPRRVLAADATKRRIALLQETALGHFELLWEYEVEQIHDLQVLPTGNVLFQTTWTRLVEVDPRSGALVWSYDAATTNRADGDGTVEVHAFQRLPDGRTMIAESGPARIIEVDPGGALVHELRLQVGTPDAHHDTRLARKTAAGTYLVAHEKDGVVREYDARGAVVWSYAVPLFGREPAPGSGFDAWGNQVFAAERLASGNTLLSTGNGHGLIEVRPDGSIAWQLSRDELEGVRLAWVTTVQVLAGGNLVLGNCHAGPEQPQIVEITRGKEVVWTFRDFERFGDSLSNSFVLEDPHAGGPARD